VSATDNILREAGIQAPRIETRRKESIATRIVQVAREAGMTPFRDPRHTPYAALGHQVYSFDGGGVRSLLGRLLYQAEVRTAGRFALDDAVDVLRADALYGDREEPVYLRVAPLSGGIAVDLGTTDWTAAVVRAGSWAIEPHPARFRRPPTLGPLPGPVGGGDLEALRRLLNLGSEDDWRLVVGFLLGALRPTGPYAALGLSGQQGSAKSVSARLLKRLIDPTTDGHGLRCLSRNDAAFWTAATNSWLPVFDNLSGLTAEQSDWLSQLATGGARTAKRLYSDGDEFVQSACRPVILNGIELGDRPDLSSRTIRLDLPAIPEESGYTVEDRLLAAFDREHPRLLGALLDALAGVVARIDSMPETGWRVRMADHVRWVTAAEASLGWDERSYEALFVTVQDKQMSAAAEAVVWLPHLASLLAAHSGTYEASASDLLDSLLDRADATRKDFGWPKTPRGMTEALTRHAPALQVRGITHRAIPDPHAKANRHHFDFAGVAGVAGVEGPSVSDREVEQKKGKQGAPPQEGNDTRASRIPALVAVRGWPEAPTPTDSRADHPPCPPALYAEHLRGITWDSKSLGWHCPAGCQYPN
jgi:putative DNA primase/helicase